MNKQLAILSGLVVVTAAVTGGAVYQYNHKQDVTNAAIVKANNRANAAASETIAYKTQLGVVQTQNASLITTNQALCANLKAHKLTDPTCK